MVRFEPFAGIRYDTDRVAMVDVTAPPYDVINAEDRARLAARSPYNVVLVDCPMPTTPGRDPDDDCYVEAGGRFASWQQGGILRTDHEPCLYPYRMSFVDAEGLPRSTLGALGALELMAPGTGDVLPHEHTTPKARSDRLRLLRATAANLSPVWGLSLAPGLTELLAPEGPPMAAWSDDEGVEHALWRMRDPVAIARVTEAVAASPVVIADGHHRYETSLAYRDERRAGAEDTAGDYDLTLAYVVELTDAQITVGPIHRLLSGLPDRFDPLDALTPWFDVGAAGPPASPALVSRMVDDGALALVLPGATWLLHPRPEAFGGAADLDSSRLDLALAGFPPHELAFQHGVDHVRREVDNGTADAGVLLRPASVAQIAEVAHARDRMPPKTTFFWPKVRTGLVFRTLG